LNPEPGDTFTAYIRTYTDTGASLDPGRIRGQTITFSDQPLTASFGPTISGDYVMGFLVRDIAGYYNYEFIDVTVDNSGAGGQPGGGQPGGGQPGGGSYANSDLAFQLAIPPGWEDFDTGNDKIVFFETNANNEVYFSVDVYSLGASTPQDANIDLLNQLIDLLGSTPGGNLRVDQEDFNLAGLPGRKIEYVYTNESGGPSYAVSITITSSNTGYTYLLTAEAPEELFDSQVDMFNGMLGSLTVE
jgi:hypothetical protein